MKRCLFVGIVMMGMFARLPGQPTMLPPADSTAPVFERLTAEAWVDSLMRSMSTEEKIGQLFMVAVFPEQGPSHILDISKLLADYHIGGLVMMQADAATQQRLLYRFQGMSRVPLLVAQDAEWGPGMRLKDGISFPQAMTLGAIQNDSLLFQMGQIIGRQLRNVGVQVNFAPVLDINIRAENPVINFRSFGENKYNVARKGILFSQGLQSEGVLAVGKHFPGHGDTHTDSHEALPLLSMPKARLDTLELYPFAKAVEAGMGGVMVGHLYIPALDPTPFTPSSLSPRVVQELLRENMGFDGLIFTDALNMRALTDHHAPGELDLQALLAGNDILVFPQNISQAFSLIKGALRNGSFPLKELNQKVRRILLAKYRLGLDTLALESGMDEYFLNTEARILRKKLYEAAMTLVRNQKDMVPLQHLSYRKIAYVQVGGSSLNSFDANLRKYAGMETFYLRKAFTAGERERLLERLKSGGYNTIITGIFDLNQQRAARYGLRTETIRLCEGLQQLRAETAVCVFGSPYVLEYLPMQQAMLVAYEEEPEAEQAAAAALFGGIPLSGRLPVSASSRFPEGRGISIAGKIRFGFAYPEEEGLDSQTLAKIDSIAQHYIDRKAMPGCAILVLKGNNIVYDKGFGYTQSAKEGEKVDPYLHTYDLASVTKALVTTISVMQLVERGWLKLDVPIETYLPELRHTDKGKLTIRRLLQHNAGLPGWVPFYTRAFKDESLSELRPDFCSYEPTDSHTVKIAPHLYITPAFQDTIWKQITELEVRRTRRVRYSDIGMILLGRIVETASGIDLETYTQNLFYRPMGMNQTLFNPAAKGRAAYCPPTQIDNYWRHSVVRGFVHDETAAILGGKAGHAGLFSNIYDLAKVLLMLKNGGIYGNEEFMSDSIIQVFTHRQLRSNRKGLGWDKPEVYENRSNPVSKYASAETFGHTGFTGTSVWVDPTFDIVYVFLSNRTYPYANNRLLQRENVRVLIMDQIYEAMFSYQRQHL